jgi:hypothetical protein
LGEVAVQSEEMTHYVADDRVKLSHHYDGFCQFSGERPGTVVSGRDALTGEPKGLGILTAPIRRPITSGPTFGVTAWGLQDFQSRSPSDNDILFGEPEIYYRDCMPSEANAIHIEGWVMSENMWSGVRGPTNGLRLSMGFRGFQGSGANLDFRVIPLEPPSRQFLAIMVCRIESDFSSTSGFTLTSPSDRKSGTTVGRAMMAMYPRLPGQPREAKNLTFTRVDQSGSV